MIRELRLPAWLALGACFLGPLTATAAPNPFAAPSTLPFHAPPFDRIKDSDYAPAFEAAMKQQLAEVAAIVANPAPPTFENTIAALDRSGRMLNRVNDTFGNLTQANTNPTLDKVQTLEAPKLAEEQDAISLNVKLFARIKAVYDQRATLNLDQESLQLLTIDYRQFVHNGANLSAHDKAELTKIDEDLATLTATFQQKLVAATKAGALIVGDRTKLDGLSDVAVDGAAHAAQARGLAGKWLIALDHATQQPALSELNDRATRELLYNDRWTASQKGDANDTRSTIAAMAQLRARRAQLLGYPNYAAYELYDQMAQTPEAVQRFIGQLAPPAAAKAAAESRLIQAQINKEAKPFRMQPWDWARYAAQVQMARYDMQDSELKPYFELHSVLENGVFYAAHELYGLTFKRRTDIPVYQPDVIVYEVFDQDGKSLSLIYFDFFQRDNKAGGAWMNNFVEQSYALGTKPVISNVLNIPKPAPGQPALLSFGDVTAMFHEFGHALHGMFASQKYLTLSGTNVALDFVEFPSQFNEHWALYPAVLRHYAHHYQTGAVIPEALVEKIRKAQTWGRGYDVAEVLAASELDMSWHMLPASAAKQDVDAFESKALRDSHTDFPNVPPRYRSSYFMHIWANGYAAGYYAYQWCIMLDDDTYAWFVAHGGLTRSNGQRFRDLILSRGHTVDYNVMFRAFYGKDPDIGPMLEANGLSQEH